ncbi:MAG: hypothetical protein LBR26_13865 [Prevotella sp.]|jgi:hypothetical protein|nr:hypothetical protein [Prevotella sp.]
MKRIGYALMIVLCLTSGFSYGRVTYATDRLQAIATRLSIQEMDTLSPGIHTGFRFRRHPLTIRVNRWNEVEHIGFRLFDVSVRDSHPSPVYDFPERYLLELSFLSEADRLLKTGIDKVRLETGNTDAIYNFTGSESFRINLVELLSYRVAWEKNSKEILALSFPMDYQLLSGCNAVELERNFVRDISRFTAGEEFNDLFFADEPDNEEKYYIREGGHYLVDAIRSDLYYVKAANGWELVSDASKLYWSVSNMMLSPCTPGTYDLEMELDEYGYKSEKISLGLKEWICFCLKAGCTPYFGIKANNDSAVTGTAFMVNPAGGYCHMLSAAIPLSCVEARRGTVRGRLFVYIPLHNVSEKYFKFDYTSVKENKNKTTQKKKRTE